MKFNPFAGFFVLKKGSFQTNPWKSRNDEELLELKICTCHKDEVLESDGTCLKNTK